MTEITPGALTMTLTEFLKWQERHPNQKYDHITVTLTTDELKDVAWKYSEDYLEQRDEIIRDLVRVHEPFADSPAKSTSTNELVGGILSSLESLEQPAALTDEQANHIVWLCLHELSKIQLEVFTFLEVNGKGQPVLVLWDLEEQEVRVESYADYEAVRYYVTAYIAFCRENGKLGHPDHRKNDKYNHLSYPTSAVTRTLRRHFRDEPFDEAEKTIYTLPFTQSPHPFTAEYIAQQEGAQQMLKLLHLIGHVSEENGFWYGTRSHQFNNNTFTELPTPVPYIHADCSDFFSSGTADLETLTENNFPLYEAAFRNVEKFAPEDWDVDDVALTARKVFAVQVRKEEPHEARIQSFPSQMQALFRVVEPITEYEEPTTPVTSNLKLPPF